MHKDKENGIVMMPKFASTFFSITHFGFLSPFKCFFFHLKLLFFTRQQTTIYSTRPFLPSGVFFFEIIWFVFFVFPPFDWSLIPISTDLRPSFYSLWVPFVADHCMIVYRTHQLIDFVLVPLMIPAANLSNFANFFLSLFYTFRIYCFKLFLLQIWILILIQNFPLQSLSSIICFFPFGIFCP